MWKIISLSILLTFARAANIQDLYGEWIEVAFYPVSTYAPVCIRFAFDTSTDNVQCTYADGRNTTLVEAYMMTVAGELIQRHSMPIRVVDTPAEVMPALDITVKCGDKDIRDRAVARLVNKDYFIMYQHIPESMAFTRTEIEQNAAVLFARNVVTAEELSNVMMSIEDLKNRRGAQMCGKENYGGFKTEKVRSD